jgi:hypothetical protein
MIDLTSSAFYSTSEEIDGEALPPTSGSFSEFAKATLTSLGLLVLVAFGTYLLFSGIATALWYLISQ